MSDSIQPTVDDDTIVEKKDKMEKLQYPADREFEKIIDDYLSMESIQDHHQTRAGFIPCTNSMDTLADASRKVLYGYESFKFFQKEALESDTTTKSSAFRWSSDADSEEVVSDLREKRRRATVYGDKDVHVRDVTVDEDDVKVELEFTIEKRGKLQGLSRYRKSTSFTVRDFKSDGSSTVYHEYDKINKQTAIREFIEGWNDDRDDQEKEEITTTPIALTELGLSTKVKFVRDLMSMETENWTRRNVEGIQVKRDETVAGEDDDEEDLDAELEGIRNAALSGKRLDTNEFVQKCEDNGFYLTKIEVRYEHQDVARRAVIEIDFKEERRETFEVSINKTLKQKESGWVNENFSMSDMKNIREEFRSSVIEKFDEYLSEEDDLELEPED